MRVVCIIDPLYVREREKPSSLGNNRSNVNAFHSIRFSETFKIFCRQTHKNFHQKTARARKDWLAHEKRADGRKLGPKIPNRKLNGPLFGVFYARPHFSQA